MRCRKILRDAASMCTLLVVTSGGAVATSYSAIEVNPSTLNPSRIVTKSPARIYVAAYDALVAATFKASRFENSPNVLERNRGIGAEIVTRERFDEKLHSLLISSTTRNYVVNVERSDHLIEVDLRHLESSHGKKGIVNSDPLNFYVAVAALATSLGVESTTWPPVSPAGPTAGD